MGDRHDAELAQAALCTAIAVRGGDVAGVIFHTDQGGEYTGEPFRQAGAAAGITQSMGRTGSALDNAVSEAFHSTLQFELLADQPRSPPAPRHERRSPAASTSTTPSGGTPPAACSRRSPTNIAGRRHDQTATRQATGPPHLRPGRHASLRDRLRPALDPAAPAPSQAVTAARDHLI